MLTKAQKAEQIDWIRNQLESKPLVVFATYRGLNISDMTALRRQLKGQGIGLKVVKSSLLKLAMKNLGLELDRKIASLPLALAFGNDEVMPAKLLAKFIADHPALAMVGGVQDQKFVSADIVNSLARLPSRQELFARLVGVLRQPASRFVNALSYPGRGLTGLLRQKFSISN